MNSKFFKPTVWRITTHKSIHSIAQHYIHHITLHYITLHYRTLHCIAWHGIAFHCIALLALHIITFHAYQCISYLQKTNLRYIHSIWILGCLPIKLIGPQFKLMRPRHIIVNQSLFLLLYFFGYPGFMGDVTIVDRICMEYVGI